MAQELIQGQVQNQVQTQIMTPQQLLVVKLLELPVTDLETRVRNELVDNSALEEHTHDEREYGETEEFSSEDSGNEDAQNEVNGDVGGDEEDTLREQRNDYASDDDIPDYLLQSNYRKEGMQTIWAGESESFYDKLMEQMGERNLTERQQTIIEYLVGSLDSDGLLRKDLDMIVGEIAFRLYIEVSKTEVEECLEILKGFEPCGIASQSLQECLVRQLKNNDCNFKYKELEIKMLSNSFDDFSHKRMGRLAERYGLDLDTLRLVYAELTRLNPRPGSGLSDTISTQGQAIVPDFIVHQDDEGELMVGLNNGDVPQLRVSHSFKEIVDEYSKNRSNLTRDQREAYIYSKQKIEAAQSFINAIMQRRQTLLKTMNAIVSIQREYFLEGDEALIKPMILKDISQKTGLDMSTISRVTGSKYVQTDFGIQPLKFFFNDSFVNKDGEEISKIKIKAVLKEIIAAEDKNNPLGDLALMDALKERGYDVARRTIAKYREQMGIPVARLRK